MDKSPGPGQALDHAQIEAALVKAHGSIKVAAKALGVHPSALRTLIGKSGRLFEAALEIEEQRLDAAEAAILRSIRHGPLSTRLVAAHAFLTMTGKLGR